MIYKCKMCGGALQITDNASMCICEYCGSKQTLPKNNDDEKAELYERANKYRRNSEYDKAANIYEQILSKDITDSEIYWSLVLCRYGIEYVEDPKSHKRIPTVNRASYTSILMDSDYISALEFASEECREIYESEAETIDKIQKNIIEASKKEEPYDIFICYKETDDKGERTKDSVLAYEIYEELTRNGFRCFFSRISLENKLGSAYEPYIFAALQSAKVMIVVGSRKEYFEAPWVKNEWSRYLSLIKNGADKKIVPAFIDINANELPEEFGYLQSQDMSKLGSLQDLVQGVNKIIGKTQSYEPIVKTQTVVVSSGDKKNTIGMVIFMSIVVVILSIMGFFLVFGNKKNEIVSNESSSTENQVFTTLESSSNKPGEVEKGTLEAFLYSNPKYLNAFQKTCNQTLSQYKNYYSNITFEVIGNEVIYSYYYLKKMASSAGNQIIDGLSQQADDAIFGDFQKLGSFDEITVTFRYYQPNGEVMCEYSRSTN